MGDDNLYYLDSLVSWGNPGTCYVEPIVYHYSLCGWDLDTC